MDDIRLIKLGRRTTSGQVCDRPCFVYSFSGVGSATVNNLIEVYDGFGTDGKLIFTFVTIPYACDFRSFSVPIFFSKGIYVEFVEYGEEFFAQYLEVGR